MAYVVDRDTLSRVFNFETRLFYKKGENPGAWPFFLENLYQLRPTNGTYVCHDNHIKKVATIRVWHKLKINKRDCPSKISLTIDSYKIQPEYQTFSFKIVQNGKECVCPPKHHSTEIENLGLPLIPQAFQQSISTFNDEQDQDQALFNRWLQLKQKDEFSPERAHASTAQETVQRINSPWEAMNFGHHLSEEERKKALSSVQMLDDEYYKVPRTMTNNLKRKAISPAETQHRQFTKVSRKLVKDFQTIDYVEAENIDDLLAKEILFVDQSSGDESFETSELSGLDSIDKEKNKELDEHDCGKPFGGFGNVGSDNDLKAFNHFFGGESLDKNKIIRKIKKEANEEGNQKKKASGNQNSQPNSKTLIAGIDFANFSKGDEAALKRMEEIARARTIKKNNRIAELKDFKALNCRHFNKQSLRREIKEFSSISSQTSEPGNDYNPVLITTEDVFTEHQIEFIMKELDKHEKIDSDKVVEVYLPEFIIYVFGKIHKMNREQTLQHFATKNELFELNLRK